jgi:hypothetical protein
MMEKNPLRGAATLLRLSPPSRAKNKAGETSDFARSQGIHFINQKAETDHEPFEPPHYS